MRSIVALLAALALFVGGANADAIGGQTVSGETRLQLRPSTLGLVTVSIQSAGHSQSVTANADGSWALLGVPDGVYALRADAPFYLPSQGTLTVSGAAVSLPRNYLLAGDLNDSGGINAADVGAMFSNWGKITQEWPLP